MGTDFRVSTTWRKHRKRKRLLKSLGAEAVLALEDLWSYAAEMHPNDGVLVGMTAEDIALEVDYQGDPEKFLSELVAIGLLDAPDPTGNDPYRLHDWTQHQRWLAHAKQRSDFARKGAEAKWLKFQNHDMRTACGEQCSPDAVSMRRACGEQCSIAAPTPTPTPTPSPSPNPRLKKETPASEKAARFFLSDLLHGKLQEEDLLLQSYREHRGLVENMLGILVCSHRLKRPSEGRAFLHELSKWPTATVIAVAKSLSEWDQKFFVGPKAIRTMLEKQAAQNIKPRKVDARGQEIKWNPGYGP